MERAGGIHVINLKVETKSLPRAEEGDEEMIKRLGFATIVTHLDMSERHVSNSTANLNGTNSIKVRKRMPIWPNQKQVKLFLTP